MNADWINRRLKSPYRRKTRIQHQRWQGRVGKTDTLEVEAERRMVGSGKQVKIPAGGYCEGSQRKNYAAQGDELLQTLVQAGYPGESGLQG